MSLPNLQDILKNIPEPYFFWWKTRWSLLRSIDGQTYLSRDSTSVKDMCDLIERVYAALGYGEDHTMFCKKTESNQYLIIHNFLEAYTDGGKLSLVKQINKPHRPLDPVMINTLKDQLAMIRVSRIPDHVLQYKESSVVVVKIGLFSKSRLGSVIEDPLSDFECPISHEIMSDPVTAPDGNTYDRSSLQEWYDKGHRTCPLSRDTILPNPTKLRSSYLIKRRIEKHLEHESLHNQQELR